MNDSETQNSLLGRGCSLIEMCDFDEVELALTERKEILCHAERMQDEADFRTLLTTAEKTLGTGKA